MADVNQRTPDKNKQSITDPGEPAINSRSPSLIDSPKARVELPSSKASADYVVIEQLVDWRLGGIVPVPVGAIGN